MAYFSVGLLFIMSEGSTSRGSGVKAIIADLQQKIAESDGEWLSDRALTQMRARAGGRGESEGGAISIHAVEENKKSCWEM